MTTNAYTATVGAGGRVEIDTAFPPGTRVGVIVITPTADADTADLVAAAESSTGFWDNPIDDEVWNAADPG